MNFQESVEYLLSLGNEVSAMKLGLENIRKLLRTLGDPQNNYLKVQVAGTNGKGSVCAFVNSICIRAGIRTGMYTSPHLVSITERVQIDGVDISKEEFARFATTVRDTSDSLAASGAIESVPTFFEQVTAIALLAFADAKVELAILETGLGGRLDATTAANAEIAAITRIDIDHQQYLGETIDEIAAEKAAIIHNGSRVVIGEQVPEVMEVILNRCRSVGVSPAIATEGRNPTRREGVLGNDGMTNSLPLEFPLLGLAGRHQIQNARTAVSIAVVLREHFTILDQHIIDGLKNARHPGRLEHIGSFLLDGAHNAGGARVLSDYLDEAVDRPIILIFGAMEDKAVGEIASILFPRADWLILTRPENSRAVSPEDVVALLPAAYDRRRVIVTGKVADAVEKARSISSIFPSKAVIVVTGSLYLVGEVKRLLQTPEFEI